MAPDFVTDFTLDVLCLFPGQYGTAAEFPGIQRVFTERGILLWKTY